MTVAGYSMTRKIRERRYILQRWRMDSILMWIERSDCKFAEFLRQAGEEYREETENENKE